MSALGPRLSCNPTYLFDEKPCVDNQGPVEDAEHQERPPADVIEGVRGDLRENKVEQPLSRRANGNTDLTDPRWEDFAHVDLMLCQYKTA